MTEKTVTEELKKKDKTSSTFINNMKLPIHGWFRYTAGFSAEWVKSIFDEFPNDKNILDPFLGSGTVLIEGQLNGKNTYGVEAHTLIHKIAEAKLLWQLSIEDFLKSAELLIETAKTAIIQRKVYPKLLVRI